METQIKCPSCSGTNIVKNGRTHHGKQNYKCKYCRRQFIFGHREKLSQAQQEMLRRALLERVSLRGICRIFGISFSVLMRYVIRFWNELPEELPVELPNDTPADIIVFALEADELWSFVGSKDNEQWIWLAIERKTRQVVGYWVGDHSQESALGLYLSIPKYVRHRARFYTDELHAYGCVFPKQRHESAAFKELRKTKIIERFNNTLRQRCARLVRKTLSFSKKLEQHINAIYFFLVHYNFQKIAALQPYFRCNTHVSDMVNLVMN